MILIRFEYLRSDSGRKLLIGQFELTHVKKWNSKAQTCSKTFLGCQRVMEEFNVYLVKIGAKSLRDGSQDICKDTESNLGPFAGFQG